MRLKEINPVKETSKRDQKIVIDLSSHYDTRGADVEEWRYILGRLLTGGLSVRDIFDNYKVTYGRIDKNMQTYLKEIKPIDSGLREGYPLFSKEEPYYSTEQEQMDAQAMMAAPRSANFVKYVAEMNNVLLKHNDK